uniref:(California timema) hypothetical protein n=1 Tax=Timema californicum TaxID=61474 RepID=A0A7R9J852_TIMCA|nr:unnamed protein product [Timema californicum]
MQELVYVLLLTLVVVNGSSWRYINKVDPYGKDEILFPSDRTSPFNEKFVNTGQDLHKKYQVAVEAIYGVAVRLKLFMDVLDTTNFLVSPLSVATAIGELLLGAQGQSRERLEWLLSTGNNQTVSGDPFELHRQLGGLVQLLQADTKQHYDGYTLEFASAFFVQPDLKIKPSYEHAITTLYGVQVLPLILQVKPSYEHAITTLYGVQVFPLNFSGDPEHAKNTINQWTSVQTKGKIQSVLPSPLPPGTSTILVNTVYFKSDWEMPFDPELTVPGLFHVAQDRNVKVQLMRGHFDLLYADSERLGCRLVALPYKKSEAAMFIILPYNHLGNKTYNIQQYMNTILVEDIIDLISSSVLTPVTLALPKMTLRDVLSISEVVGKVRSKLNESDPPIKDVSSKRYQKRSTQYWREDRKSRYKLRYSYNHQYYYSIPVDAVVMEVSESGTEAAAVTAGTIDYIGGGKVFKVDSPFFFFIRHEATLASLFWGMIVDPTNGQGEYT